MDINILVACLGLLVAALAEGRSILRDKRNDEQITGVILLLRLILKLDDIIQVGNEIISILVNIPLVENEQTTRFALLRKKREILKLVNIQMENLRAFSHLYDDELFDLGSETQISLKRAFEFMVPDQIVKNPHPKRGLLNVLTWKLLEGEPQFSLLRAAASRTLSTFSDNIMVEKELTEFRITTPSRVQVNTTQRGYVGPDSILIINSITYDLKKPKDLRALIAKSKQDLDELRQSRIELAHYISETFTLSDLLKK